MYPKHPLKEWGARFPVRGGPPKCRSRCRGVCTHRLSRAGTLPCGRRCLPPWASDVSVARGGLDETHTVAGHRQWLAELLVGARAWRRGPAWPRVAAGAARSVAKTAPQLPSSPCCPCAWVPRPLRRPVPLAARCTLCSLLFPCVVGLRCPGAIPRPHSPAEGGSQPLPGSLGQEPETGGQTGVHTDGRTCAGASP